MPALVIFERSLCQSSLWLRFLSTSNLCDWCWTYTATGMLTLASAGVCKAWCSFTAVQAAPGAHGNGRSLYTHTTRDYSVNSSMTTLDVHLSPDHAHSWRKPLSEPLSTSGRLPYGASGGEPGRQQAQTNEQHALPEKVSIMATV